MARDIVEQLRVREGALEQVPISLAADMRVRRSLREARGRAATPVRWLLAGVALGIGGMALLSATRATSEKREPSPVAASNAPSRACVLNEQGAQVELNGRCTFRFRTISISSDANAVLRRDERAGLELLRGEAWFDVDPVAPGSAPVQIRVADGSIEVLGTRFLLKQDERGGSVWLTHGRIRFTARDRAPLELLPGQRHTWRNTSEQLRPQPSVTAPRSVAHPRAVPSARVVAVPLEAELGRAMQLRSQGRLAEAAKLLQRLNRTSLDARSAEAVSFELGSVLERLGDTRALCAHYAEHVRRFPSGDTRSFVEGRKRSRCEHGTGNSPPADG